MQTVSILLVEDDDLDAEALERMLRRERIANPLYRAHEGEEALQMLRGEPGVLCPPAPRLVLLDLNMPGMNGLEFLAELRADADPDLRRTVTFVLTTSDEDKERTTAYDHGVAGYIVKSRAGQDFRDLTKLVSSYWQVVVFP